LHVDFDTRNHEQRAATARSRMAPERSDREPPARARTAPWRDVTVANQTIPPVSETGRRVPPVVEATLWMVLASLLLSAMAVLIKLLGARHASAEIAFFRSLFGLIAALPFAIATRAAIRPGRLLSHLLPGAVAAIGMITSFYAWTALPLAFGTALSFTTSIQMSLLAALLLGEIVGRQRWAATLVGFAGVLVMVRPAISGEGIAVAAALASTFFIALSQILIKRLSITERPVAILVSCSLVWTLVLAGPAAVSWTTPDRLDVALFAALGIFGTAAQACTIRAYSRGEASTVAPFDYLRLVFAVLFGFAIFGEHPDLWTLAGTAILISGSIAAARSRR
jgi:drug/metabolite transporter (DMT)-like permease